MKTESLGLWTVRANYRNASGALLVWSGLKPEEAIELQEKLRESGEYANIRAKLEK